MNAMSIPQRGTFEMLSTPTYGRGEALAHGTAMRFHATVAHEVRQPLAAIVADAGACRRWLAAPSPDHDRVRSIVERILDNAMSAAEIVDSLRILFASCAPAAHAATQLNEVIREACARLRPDLEKRQIEIAFDLDPDLPSLAADRTLIRQLLINLIRNAAEAMETSPALRRLRVRSRICGGEVRVDVCDRGGGAGDTAHMFDAFFSTKPQGMGMGLAICRQIVAAHGGRFWMEPREGTGTRMSFALPIRDPFADKTGVA